MRPANNVNFPPISGHPPYSNKSKNEIPDFQNLVIVKKRKKSKF